MELSEESFMTKWEGPDFVIAGTQKAGTTWLERQLGSHPDIFTPRKQLHYFDRNYRRGEEWYSQWFQKASDGQLCGEKTTEYFDTTTVERFAQRVSTDYPDLKVIVILRDPVNRALSALRHMVNSGLEKRPADPGKLLFDDMNRSGEKSYRYIERGFYDRQLAHLERYISPNRLQVLIFEEDIVGSPITGLSKICEFLEIEPVEPKSLQETVNKLRLSAFGADLSHQLYSVPYARSLIRRLDRWLGASPWEPNFQTATIESLKRIFEEPNEALFNRLDRNIPSWAREIKE